MSGKGWSRAFDHPIAPLAGETLTTLNCTNSNETVAVTPGNGRNFFTNFVKWLTPSAAPNEAR